MDYSAIVDLIFGLFWISYGIYVLYSNKKYSGKLKTSNLWGIIFVILGVSYFLKKIIFN